MGKSVARWDVERKVEAHRIPRKVRVARGAVHMVAASVLNDRPEAAGAAVGGGRNGRQY